MININRDSTINDLLSILEVSDGPETAAFEIVTPDMAQSWLLLNSEKNRKLRRKKVIELADEMYAGAFYPTNQGIGFTVDGDLIDGQHRLSAIVESGMPQKLLVVKGLNPFAFGAIDIGLKRQAGEITGLGTKRASALRFGVILAKSFGTSRYQHQLSVTPRELIQLNESEFGKTLERVFDFRNKRFFSSAGVLCAATVSALMSKDPDAKISEFLFIVNQNFDEMTSVGKALMKRIIADGGTMRSSQKGSEVTVEHFCSMMYVLDPSNRDKQKLHVSQNSLRYINSASEFMRRYVAT